MAYGKTDDHRNWIVGRLEGETNPAGRDAIQTELEEYDAWIHTAGRCVVCGGAIEPEPRYFTDDGRPRHMLCDPLRVDLPNPNRIADLLDGIVGPATTFEARDEARELVSKALDVWYKRAESFR